jgi:hypothetical protein
MKKLWIGFGLGLSMSVAAGVVPAQLFAAPAGAQNGVTLPWLQPPPEFREMQRKGFHAGVQAAVKDFDHHKEPDLERHKEYVKPKVDRSYVPDWRDGYKRGYNDAYKHLVKSHGQAS